MSGEKLSGGFRTAGDLGGALAPKKKTGAVAVKETVSSDEDQNLPQRRADEKLEENNAPQPALKISMGKKKPAKTEADPKAAPPEKTESPKAEVSPAPKAPEVTVAAVSAPAVPVFMRPGDLLSAASGSLKESKGSTWDDYALRNEVTVIGRNKNCDIVADQGGIAAEHARITRYNGRFVLSDCNSDAGTYVNGKRLTKAVYLQEKDQIALGGNNYVFSAGKLLYAKTDDPAVRAGTLRGIDPRKRPIVLSADIKTKVVEDNSGAGMKELIRDIRLDVREGSLVALLGTAGAGKSTVMNCMNGMDLGGVQGRVFFRNVDLVQNFEQMRHLIGNVPQEKTFLPSLTPEETFKLAAQLRLPEDTTDQEINRRVDQTLKMLSIEKVRKRMNSKLSGGEKTRVNVGIELVADRDLLCLDEPDQGLSPNYKHDIFQIMQDLAHKHCKTVISIIHDVSEIDMFDQVIILAKFNNVGRLAFSGTPAEARAHFGADIRDVYAILERDPGRYIR